jgi:hypothetical protein
LAPWSPHGTTGSCVTLLLACDNGSRPSQAPEAACSVSVGRGCWEDVIVVMHHDAAAADVPAAGHDADVGRSKGSACVDVAAPVGFWGRCGWVLRRCSNAPGFRKSCPSPSTCPPCDTRTDAVVVTVRDMPVYLRVQWPAIRLASHSFSISSFEGKQPLWVSSRRSTALLW